MSVIIRDAKPEDCVHILQLIRELAQYEKALDEVELTVEMLKNQGFGENTRFSCFVAEEHGMVVGMALTYPRYSTWKGPYTYLEDLVVDPQFRKKGIGSKLLKTVIDVASKNNSARLEWQVLNWNKPAIEFYRKFNASFDYEWINVRLTGEQLKGGI